MKRALTLLLAAAPAAAQDTQDSQYFQRPEKKFSFEIKGDALARAEWTRDIFVTATQFRDEDRQRLQLRPRLEIGLGKLLLGVGGEFNYSSDENTKAAGAQALIRDNYDSRGARFDPHEEHDQPERHDVEEVAVVQEADAELGARERADDE